MRGVPRGIPSTGSLDEPDPDNLTPVDTAEALLELIYKARDIVRTTL